VIGDRWGRRSPRGLLGLADPAVGQHFTSAAGKRPGRVLSVDPQRHLTGRIAGALLNWKGLAETTVARSTPAVTT